MLNRRPKPGESEDDLIRFQQEFLSSESSPSASVVRPGEKRKSPSADGGKGSERDIVQLEGLPSNAPSISSIPGPKKSRFKALGDSKHKTPVDLTDPESEIDKHDTSTAAILTEIIERDTHNVGVSFPQLSPYGFPQVVHRGVIKEQSGKSNKSLFAQQMSIGQKGSFSQPSSSKPSASMPDKVTSTILQGSGGLSQDEVGRIHKENMATLSNMSQEEILNEQRKLMEAVDPKILEFLKSKKRQLADKTDEKLSAQPMMEMTESAPVEDNQLDVRMEEQKAGSSDVPIAVNTEWVNMDVVETEKLAWMKDLPPPRTDNSKTDKPARFDFQGNLLSEDVDLPVTLGLHHHGDEPERAGYTLEELFILSRSSNVQQRSLALNILARIISKAKSGTFIDHLQSAILPTILDAGVVFLVRWALDDSIDMVLMSALSALHAILVNPIEEAALDEVFSWHGGVSVVAQYPVEAMEETKEMERQNEEDKIEEVDADILKKDLIYGLVYRMTILPRFNHYLSRWRPQAPSVLNILALLTRITRHSQQAAYQVMNCPGLVETVVKEFLPTSWKPLEYNPPLSCLYGYPVPSAVRLLRTIVQAGRNMAAILESKYNVLSKAMVYIAMDIKDLPLPEEEGLVLQRETYDLWRTYLLYGHGTQHYLDMYPALVRQLRRLQTLDYSKVKDLETTLYSSFICVLEAAVIAAGETTQTSSDRESVQTSPSALLSWSHVDGLLPPVRELWDRLREDIIFDFQHKKGNLSLISSVTNFMATFFKLNFKQSGANTVKLLEDIEQFSSPVICNTWSSVGFQTILTSLSKYSNILSTESSFVLESSPNLPEVTSGSDVKGQVRPCPILRHHSPVSFLTSFCRLTLNICSLHKGLVSMILPVIVKDPYILVYLNKVSSLRKAGSFHNNPLTKFENYLHYYLIKMASLLVTCEAMEVYHKSSLSLLTRLNYGDEHLVHDLLSFIIFDNRFLGELSEDEMMVKSLEEIQLTDVFHLKSATQQDIHSSHHQLLRDSVTCLPSIRASYLTAFGHMTRDLQLSRSRHLYHPRNTETFFTSRIGECLLPADWMFLPLVTMYNKSLNQPDKEFSPPGNVQLVRNCLRWVYLLECWRPEALATVSVTLKLSRIICVFLAGNDLFLDSAIHCYLAALLRTYTKPNDLQLLNFDLEIPGLTSFYDMYVTLLQQYQAVSFGDSLFGCYLLIPLQQQHSSLFKKAVWGEYSGVLRTLNIPIKELLVPLKCYLEPDEDNLEVIRLYTQCLLSQTVQQAWSPVLYLVAVHHVNRFIYQQDGHHISLKHLILGQLATLKDQDLKTHLLWYKCGNMNFPFGMELYQELPTNRKLLLHKLKIDVPDFQKYLPNCNNSGGC